MARQNLPGAFRPSAPSRPAIWRAGDGWERPRRVPCERSPGRRNLLVFQALVRCWPKPATARPGPPPRTTSLFSTIGASHLDFPSLAVNFRPKERLCRRRAKYLESTAEFLGAWRWMALKSRLPHTMWFITACGSRPPPGRSPGRRCSQTFPPKTRAAQDAARFLFAERSLAAQDAARFLVSRAARGAPQAGGREVSESPSGRCMITESVQRPSLNPAEVRTPTGRNPHLPCKFMDAVFAESPITATIWR